MKHSSIAVVALSLFTFALQGCKSNKERSPSHPTAIGTALSITTEEKEVTMAPSIYTLEEVALKVAEQLQKDIEMLNKKESINFGTELNYCDISGERETITRGTLETFIESTTYQACQEENRLKNGKIEQTYRETNEDGKYPKNLELTVSNAYLLDEILLKESFYLSAHLSYGKKKHIKNISLKLNGLVEFNHQTLNFSNFQQKIIFKTTP
jgi:hypothetical protein